MSGPSATTSPAGDCRGQGLVEYALIICLVMLAVIVGLGLFGQGLGGLFTNISVSF